MFQIIGTGFDSTDTIHSAQSPKICGRHFIGILSGRILHFFFLNMLLSVLNKLALI